jgi:hypothetical protein
MKKSFSCAEASKVAQITKLKKRLLINLAIKLAHAQETGTPFRNPFITKKRRLYTKKEIKKVLRELRQAA